MAITSSPMDAAASRPRPADSLGAARRLRVVVVLLKLAGGGAERLVLDVLRSLPPSIERVLLLIRREGPYLEEIPADVRVAFVAEPGVRLLPAAPRMMGMLRRLCTWADVVVGGMEEDATYAAFVGGLLSRRPVVGWVHTSLEPYIRLVSPLARHPVRWLYPRLAAVVCPSQGAARALQAVAAVPAHRLHVIPNLVDTARISRMATEAIPAGMTSVFGRPVVVGVGRLYRYKGFDLVLKAHRALRLQGLDHHLLLLGDGPEAPALRALARGLGVEASVFMPGFVPNPYPLVRSARVLALPSRLESFSMVLLEAMTLGVPVVAADCCCGPAELLDGGRYGLLVQEDDATALAGALARVLTDDALARTLAREGQERAAMYAAGRVIPQWERLFTKLAGGGRP
ncbi:MAG: glycosyltransferase [Armatimonadota bacterium]|nr:glycosyltransferase [Armatimonadota bacterium]MDR7535124.1 glycosyltransferase [Armatimonadota bacterium]